MDVQVNTKADVMFDATRITTLENRLAEIEKTLKQILGNHETFVQGLEDASRELMKNDLIRVTIPAQFREKIQQFITLREQQKAATVPQLVGENENEATQKQI
jgi:hypothetical protein